jgi:hypothetical protein
MQQLFKTWKRRCSQQYTPLSTGKQTTTTLAGSKGTNCNHNLLLQATKPNNTLTFGYARNSTTRSPHNNEREQQVRNRISINTLYQTLFEFGYCVNTHVVCHTINTFYNHAFSFHFI